MQLRATRLTAIASAARRFFSPSSLFSAGEQGVWYDPSDLSTLFQDAAGTTPVTAVEQPVGKMLDKSQGLVLGPELVTNGDFSDGTTGWIGPPVFSVTDGVAYAAGSGAGSTLFSTEGRPVIAGRAYRATFTISGASNYNTLQFSLRRVSAPGVNISNIFSPAITNIANTFSVIFTPNASVGDATFLVRFAGTESVTLDNISVRELPGNHATQTTSTSRPVLKQDAGGQYYLKFDGVDDGMVTNSIDFTATDKMTVFAGVRKLSDATTGRVFTNETAAGGTDAGQTVLFAPSGAVANYGFRSGVTTMNTVNSSSAYASPHTAVLSLLADAAADSVVGRINGASFSGTSEMGVGNFPARSLSIGRGQVPGALQPFNGHLYSLIVRGAATTDTRIAQTERWVNKRTGAY